MHVSSYPDVWTVMGNNYFAPSLEGPVPARTPEGRAIEQGLGTAKLIAGMDGGGVDGVEFDGGKHKATRERLGDAMPGRDRYEQIVQAVLAETFAPDSELAQQIHDGQLFDVAASSRTVIRNTLAIGAGLVDPDRDYEPAKLDLPPGHTGTQVWDWLRTDETEVAAARNLMNLSRITLESQTYWRGLRDSNKSADRERFEAADNYIVNALRAEAERDPAVNDAEQYDRTIELCQEQLR